MNEALHIEAVMPASPKQVMDMLTDEKQLSIWSGEEASFDPTRKHISLFDGQIAGDVLAASENELRFTCLQESESGASTVAITLKPQGTDTLMSLRQENLPEGSSADARAFWENMLLTPLEDYLMIRFHRD